MPLRHFLLCAFFSIIFVGKGCGYFFREVYFDLYLSQLMLLVREYIFLMVTVLLSYHSGDLDYYNVRIKKDSSTVSWTMARGRRVYCWLYLWFTS